MILTTTENLHVAIIMDGNGRWSKKRFLPVVEGHRRGAQKLRQIVENAYDIGISHLTVFAFSSENWGRSEKEVNDLMELLRNYLATEVEFLDKSNVSLSVIGDLERLPTDICDQISYSVTRTSKNTGLKLTIALSYGAQDEIVNAAKKIAYMVMHGAVTFNDINVNTFHKYLYDPKAPMVDLLIRTSGEKRISNFLLWQIAYAELAFTETLWPDFSVEELSKIVEEYKSRERRFGKRLVHDE